VHRAARATAILSPDDLSDHLPRLIERRLLLRVTAFPPKRLDTHAEGCRHREEMSARVRECSYLRLVLRTLAMDGDVTSILRL